MKTKVAVIILNYRHYNDTDHCISSLKKTDLPNNSTIYIADNTDDKKAQQVLQQKHPDIVLVRNKRNLGFAGGNNPVIKKAIKENHTHILISNPDITFPRKFFTPLLENFQNKDVGLVAPALKDKIKNKTIHSLDIYMDWKFVKPKHHYRKTIKNKTLRKASIVTFACVLISAKVFEEIGYLDERYFMYLEDVDFCLRAQEAGFTLILDPSIVATHKTSSSFSHPRQKLKISFVSHLKFIQKWLPFPRSIFPLIYQCLLYPYLYLLWTYQSWKYQE